MGKSSIIKDTGQFKLDDSGSYDGFSDDYHECVDKLSKPFVEYMIDLANVKPGQKILDIGTGTGIVANYAAKKVENSGLVIGVDLSKGMLKAATKAAQELRINNVQFLRMDAENLALPTEYFDSVFSMYAIDHFPDAAQALKEIYRCLKPGGHLPSHSNRGGENKEKSLYRIIQNAGFQVKDTLWDHNMITIQSTEEFWRFQTAIVTEARKRLQNIEPGAKILFQEKFKKTTNNALARGGRLYYCGAAFMICATRK